MRIPRFDDAILRDWHDEICEHRENLAAAAGSRTDISSMMSGHKNESRLPAKTTIEKYQKQQAQTSPYHDCHLETQRCYLDLEAAAKMIPVNNDVL